MAQSHLHQVLAVNLSQAVLAQDTELEAQLRRLKSLLRQPAPLVEYALQVLQSPGQQELKGVVLSVLAVKKEARVPHAVVAFLRQETDPYLIVTALWCLTKYDCSGSLLFIAQQLARSEYSEAAHVLVLILQAMKGPFDARQVRQAIHLLSKPAVNTSNNHFPYLQLLHAQALHTCARFHLFAARQVADAHNKGT